MSKQTTISYIPVGNGDMTLLKIASNNSFYTVLVDMNIRDSASSDEDKCDALSELHDRLEKDDDNRPYVDVLLLTHPDDDHIHGFKKHFHQGEPDSYAEPKKGGKQKIIAKEIWSSPLIFRRKSKNHKLSDDASTFDKEARRRVKLYRETKTIGAAGNRIRIIGDDENNANDDISEIVYLTDSVITQLNEVCIKEMTVTVLGPLPDSAFDDSTDHDKNRSSIIMQWAIASHGMTAPTNHLLLGGDAGVEVWEKLWDRYVNDTENLEYDLLIAPHHCSWHTLSHDSFSKSENPKVSPNAKRALSQAKEGGVIISSSNEIKNDDTDPPNHKAKKEYEHIVIDVSGNFECLEDNKPIKKKAPEVLTFALTKSGPQRDTSPQNTSRAKVRGAAAVAALSGVGRAIPHG